MEVRSCHSSAPNLQWLVVVPRKSPSPHHGPQGPADDCSGPHPPASNPVSYHPDLGRSSQGPALCPHHAQLTPGSGPWHSPFPLLRTLRESCIACSLTSFMCLPTLTSSASPPGPSYLKQEPCRSLSLTFLLAHIARCWRRVSLFSVLVSPFHGSSLGARTLSFLFTPRTATGTQETFTCLSH